MLFKLVTGRSFQITCQACQRSLTAGSEPFHSASTGLLDGQPDEVYADLTNRLPGDFSYTPIDYYCQECARKHVDGQDTTRAVTRFFDDTKGTA